MNLEGVVMAVDLIKTHVWYYQSIKEKLVSQVTEARGQKESPGEEIQEQREFILNTKKENNVSSK